LPPEPPAARLTLAGSAQVVTTALVLIAVARALTNPSHRGARLAPLEDAEARLVWRAALVAILLPVPLTIYQSVVVAVAATPAEAALTVIAVEALVTAIRLWFFWRVRRPVKGLIEHGFGRGRGEPQSAVVGAFAGGWFVLFGALAVFRLLTVMSGQLQGVEAGEAAHLSFTLLILLPFLVGGIGAWFDDRPARAAGAGEPTTLASSSKALVQGVVLVAGLVVILQAWGIDPLTRDPDGLEDRLAGALLEAAGAVVIGWALWRGVTALLEHYAPTEGENEDLESEGMGKTGSRIDTIVPLLRSAAFGVIVLISTLMALSALGINITALLAGAGVIGLAVGFGAQALVKDVITGMFYLVEDAFRVGEYLVTAEGKGVVEKISLRSVRLRHHRGPVYTIPFGSMGTVQNHSRDWVKVKLLIRVPFDTDIEKVRKLIKKVGIAMQDEPELGEHIIQPVKSQGVLEVDDSAMIIGVKFICKPGEQFVIRREAYARIQKAFADNDIEFAPKRVIVESDSAELQRARAGAAAAAAAHTGEPGMDAAS
jgi:small-conductance mechanosensitive channel